MRVPQIILVEDNPADVLLIKMALEQNEISHTIVEFESGHIAVQTLCDPSSSAHPDLILLDLNTPRSDGFDVLEALKATFVGVPVAILTSSRARSDKERAARAGALYLEKASHLPDFLSSVASMVRRMLDLRTVPVIP